MQLKKSLTTAAVAWAAVSTGSANGAAVTRDKLGKFDTVTSCAPFGIFVTPSTGNKYSVQIDAEPAVEKKISTNVTAGSLDIGVSGSFKTTKPIKVAVNLPATALKGISSGSSASVQVDKGFKADALNVVQAGTAEVVVAGATVDRLTLAASGTGNVVVGGSIGATKITHTGTGNVGISGSSSTIQYTGSGTGNLYVKGSANTVITGSTTGLNSITFDKGTCNLPANFPFSSPCSQQASVTMPEVSTSWTCGLTVTGTFGTGNSCGSGNTVNNVVTTSTGTAAPATCDQPST